MDPGTFSGQRQGWKTPRGPSGSALLLFVYRECTVGRSPVLGISRSTECGSALCCLLYLSFPSVFVCFFSHLFCAPCGLRGCKNRPAPFPGRMPCKATKSGLVCVLYLSMLRLYCCVLGPLLCSVYFRWYVVCLLVVLVKLSLLAK